MSTKYESLAENLLEALVLFLDDAKISYLQVSYRIKDFDSFIDKCRRKKYYNEPFVKCTDICGLRIIYYYLTDIEKISKIIEKEFDVLEKEDKLQILSKDQFGYRDFQFIVKIKKEWSKTPNYRGLEDFVAEIQVRTILMHAWDEIEHELSYKKDEEIKQKIKRKLSKISAKLEDADEDFEEVRNEATEYRKEIIDKAKKEEGKFDKNLPLNLDSLQAFLDYNFPDRISRKESTKKLLADLIRNNISMSEIVESTEKYIKTIPEIEKDRINKLKIPRKFLKGDKYWSQIGVLKLIISLGNTKYLNQREISVSIRNLYLKWSEKLNN
ncbi:MAG: hypothetical protein IMZ52_09490 [Actinobacteria bacterium]|nr:hypothetical protein [Actinomycetota bacterium]